MKTKPEVSDEEIRQYMDFDAVLKKRDKVIMGRKMLIRNGLIGFATLVVVISFIWLSMKDSQVEEVSQAQEANNQVPEIKKESEPKVITPVMPKQEQGTQNVLTQKPKKLIAKPVDKTEKSTKNNELKPVYVQAEPMDGYDALYEYFNKELHYPQEAMKDSIQGIVTVMFTINKEGKPEKIQVENSLGAPFDLEAIRVIENMPLWKPATLNGTAVESKVSVPLTFHIKKLNRK